MAGTQEVLFVSNGSATGTFPGSVSWKGGKLCLGVVAGTWSSGSVQLQANFKGQWVNVGSAITANTFPTSPVELPPCQLQAVVTGAGFSGLYVSGVEVPTNTRH